MSLRTTILAFVFEAFWDLWVPNDDASGDAWVQRPVAVRFIVHGVQFDEGIYADDGHIEVDFGLDTPFLFEGLELSAANEEHVRVQCREAGGIHACGAEQLRTVGTRVVVGVGEQSGAEVDCAVAADAVAEVVSRQLKTARGVK